MDINKLPIRKLQIESSLALEILKNADNNSLWTVNKKVDHDSTCLLYTSPSPRDGLLSRMPSSA